MVFQPEAIDHHGGRWLRQAADAIAKDMLANQAVKVETIGMEHYGMDAQLLTYVARVGTPANWRALP